ncbi:hypothetical protein BTR25_14290 [Bacillus sp. MRMR6]|nr:hypothetical protein BTR25_14290 [Bacillus sp. MRMR6]
MPATDVGHHSRVLSLVEVFEIYSALKTVPELKQLKIPLLLNMMSGFRNVTLSKLTVDSISEVEKGIKYGEILDEEGEADGNELNTSKYKTGFIPLPPVLFNSIKRYIEMMHLKGNDSLLYGAQGKPLANKQLNHLVKKLCDTLRWEGEKQITPYAFRYTLSTIFGIIGVSDDAIRFMLGHNPVMTKGNLPRYVWMEEEYKEELRIAQLLLEEVLETLLMLQEHHLMNVDIEKIFKELKYIFPQALRFEHTITQFKHTLIQTANHNKQMELMNLNGQPTMQQGAPQPMQPFHAYQQANPYMIPPGGHTANLYPHPSDPNMNGMMMQQPYQMMPMNTGMQPPQQPVFHSSGAYTQQPVSYPYMHAYGMYPLGS